MNMIYKDHVDEIRRRSTQMATKKKNRDHVHFAKTHEFPTGSKYEGLWDSLGMRGYGSYNFFYGVGYDGDLYDSVFHERGTLMYNNGSKIDGFWDNGRMISHRYFFLDGLCYGPYCEMPDRRYFLEMKNMRPAGRSIMTNSLVTRKIPEGCYDTGDGFYDPEKKCVYDAKNPKKIVRIPTNEEHTWIIKNCRKAWDEPIGYKPELYEDWEDTEYFDLSKIANNPKKSRYYYQ